MRWPAISQVSVTAAINQIVEQRLHHDGVLRRPFNRPERMLVADTVDADGSHQHQVFLDVDAVNLDDQRVQLGQVRAHPLLHPLRRQRHEPARHRRFGHARPLGCRNVTFPQADGAAILARRDVDKHPAYGPLAEQVLRHGRFPTRQGHLPTGAGTHTRPFDLNLATVEAELPTVIPQRWASFPAARP